MHSLFDLIEIQSSTIESRLLERKSKETENKLHSVKPLKLKPLKQCKPSNPIDKSIHINDGFASLEADVSESNETEIELQEMSLAIILDDIEVVNFPSEKEPKLPSWKNQANKLKKKVLDAEGNPIDENSKEFIKYKKLLKAINIPKLKKLEYSVLVIKVFKKIVLGKNFDLKVYNKVIFFYNGKYWQRITEERFTSFLSNVADKMGLTELAYEHHSFSADLIKQFTHKNFAQSITDSKDICINLLNGTFKFRKGIGKTSSTQQKRQLTLRAAI